MDASYHDLDGTKARARNLLTCPLCSQPYEDPRVLHCQHTFCCRCLQVVFNDLQANHERSGGAGRVGSFQCPTCFVDVGLPSAGAVAFPVDRRIQNIKNLMVDEMMQDIARRLKSKLGSDSPGQSQTTPNNDTNSPAASKSAPPNHGQHHRSSRLGDISEFGGIDDEETDGGGMFERDTYTTRRNLFETPTSDRFSRQKPGYSSLRESKRTRRPNIDSMSFDDSRELYEKDIHRSHTATAGLSAMHGSGSQSAKLNGSTTGQSRTQSSRDSFTSRRKNNASPFSNDDQSEPYSPIIGRNRQAYSSLRERRGRPLFDPDQMFNNPADTIDRRENSAMGMDRSRGRTANLFSQGSSTVEDHLIDSCPRSASTEKFSETDVKAAMPRVAHSEPNWAANVSTTEATQSQIKNQHQHSNGGLTGTKTKDTKKTPTEQNVAKGESNESNKNTFGSPKRVGLQKVKEVVYHQPTATISSNDKCRSKKKEPITDDMKKSKTTKTIPSEVVQKPAACDILPTTAKHTKVSKDHCVKCSPSRSPPRSPNRPARNSHESPKPLKVVTSNGEVSATGEDELASPTLRKTSISDGVSSSQSPSCQSPTRADIRDTSPNKIGGSDSGSGSGNQSPMRTPTRLEPKESKFTRLSKFRSKIGRSASVASPGSPSNGSATASGESSPCVSPIMTRSQSVDTQQPPSSPLTSPTTKRRLRARQRPPVFVGTPLNFNCAVFDESPKNQPHIISESNTTNSTPNDTRDVDGCNSEQVTVSPAKQQIVDSDMTNVDSSGSQIITDKHNTTVTESRLVQEADVDQNYTIPHCLSDEHNATPTSAASQGAATSRHNVQQPSADDICAALDVLDSVTLSACDEIQLMEEECLEKNETCGVLDAVPESATDTATSDDKKSRSELQKPADNNSALPSEDEQRMIDAVCNDLLFCDEEDDADTSATKLDITDSPDGKTSELLKSDDSGIDAPNSGRYASVDSSTVDDKPVDATHIDKAEVTEMSKPRVNNADDFINDDDSVFVDNAPSNDNNNRNASETSRNSSNEQKVKWSSNSSHINSDRVDGSTNDGRTTVEAEEADTGFVSPTGVAALDDGSLVVADSGSGCLCLCNSVGSVEHRITGLKPFSVAVDNSNSERQVIWVGDRRRKTVVAFDRYGCDVAQWPDNQFDWVCGVAALPSGEIAVLDRSHVNQLGVYTPEGEFRSELGRHGSSADELCMAEFLTVDNRGRILVADSGNHCVKAFDPRTGPSVVAVFGSRGCGDGQLQWPKGVAVDSAGNVLVCDSRNGRVLSFASDGRPMCSVVMTVRSPYAVCAVSARTLAVTTYSVTGLSEFHIFDISSKPNS